MTQLDYNSLESFSGILTFTDGMSKLVFKGKKEKKKKAASCGPSLMFKKIFGGINITSLLSEDVV